MIRKLASTFTLALFAGAFAAGARAEECWSPPAWAAREPRLPGAAEAVEAIDGKLEAGLAARAAAGPVDLLIGLRGCATRDDLDSLARWGRVGFAGRYLSVVQLRGVEAADLAEIAADPRVGKVEADHRVRPALDVSVRSLRVRASHLYSPGTLEDRRPGITGAGVSIAILDTGVDDGLHESLPRAKFVGGYNALRDREGNPNDGIGHGTHVAAVALGVGRPSGALRGMAPGAGLVDVKVIDGTGGSDATVIRGIEKCIEKRAAWRIGVLNLSLGSENEQPSDGRDALSQAVDLAVRAGIVVVVAGGNAGPDGGIRSPAAADRALTVAASDDRGTVRRNDDQIYPLSSGGPRRSDGDGDTADELKPDVTAPGVEILSALANTTNGYLSRKGTSFSAAHVSGLAALLLQARPGLAPAEVKRRILATAQDFGPPGWDARWGWGLVNGWTAVR